MPECHEPMPEQSLGEISNEIQRLFGKAVYVATRIPSGGAVRERPVLRSVSQRHLIVALLGSMSRIARHVFRSSWRFRKDQPSRKRLVLRNRL